jgi:hypothetical protein
MEISVQLRAPVALPQGEIASPRILDRRLSGPQSKFTRSGKQNLAPAWVRRIPDDHPVDFADLS